MTTQEEINNKIAERQRLIDEIYYKQSIYDAAKAKVEANNKRLEYNFVTFTYLPYCTLHSNICNNDKADLNLATSELSTIIAKNDPIIQDLAQSIQVLTARKLAEDKAVTTAALNAANITPEQRLEAERQKQAEGEAAANLVLLNNLAKNKKVVIIVIASLAFLVFIGVLIARRNK